MVRPRTVRDALVGRELSGNQIDELLESLESDSPAIRAAALVAAYAFCEHGASAGDSDRLGEELRNKLNAILQRDSESHAYKCQGSKGSRPRRQLGDTRPKRERLAKRRKKHERKREAEPISKGCDVPEGCELVGWEEVPVTEPYGWSYRVRLVKVPVVSWRSK